MTESDFTKSGKPVPVELLLNDDDYAVMAEETGEASSKNPLDVLRGDHADFSDYLKYPCSPACTVCAALRAVEELVDAAHRVDFMLSPRKLEETILDLGEKLAPFDRKEQTP